MANRIETGAVEFEDDWSGVFIRGDNAMYFASQLTTVLELMKEQWGDGYFHTTTALHELKALLLSANQHQNSNKQLLKSYLECKR